MNNKEAFAEMFNLLGRNYVFSSNNFRKDIERLVTTDIVNFIKFFVRDIRRKNFDEYNKYEILKLTPKQRKKLDGKNLYRYEYRKNSNLRCIYTIDDEDNIRKIILLCAFNENGNKGRGQNSYKDNITRAIEIYLSIQ